MPLTNRTPEPEPTPEPKPKQTRMPIMVKEPKRGTVAVVERDECGKVRKLMQCESAEVAAQWDADAWQRVS